MQILTWRKIKNAETCGLHCTSLWSTSVGMFLHSNCWKDWQSCGLWPYWGNIRISSVCNVSSAKDLAVQRFSDLISQDPSVLQTAMPEMLSKEEDEVIAPLFWAGAFGNRLWTGFITGRTPPPGFIISSSSKDALQFHDLVDCMIWSSTLNLLAVPVEESSHPVFDSLVLLLGVEYPLPVLGGLLQLAKSVWSASASCHLVSREADKLYQMPSWDFSSYVSILYLIHWWWLLPITGQDLDCHTPHYLIGKGKRLICWREICSHHHPSVLGWQTIRRSWSDTSSVYGMWLFFYRTYLTTEEVWQMPF